MELNKRDLAIIGWAKEHRPDFVENIEKILINSDEYPAPALLLSLGFEGGRKFQSENPEAEMTPNAY